MNSNINSNHGPVKTGFSTNYQIDFTFSTITRKIESMYNYLNNLKHNTHIAIFAFRTIFCFLQIRPVTLRLTFTPRYSTTYIETLSSQ
ncbi:hypothetical protein VIGAN_05127600, partial [Vigna angularis var. angularis]